MEKKFIRNFSIIAHIDHGKSTLADRFLEVTSSIEKRDYKDQILDSMDLERERGITIKSHPVRMLYKRNDGIEYEFNLIDTPGHVDFSYEVSRSLAACEGALLLVDAAQGVQAQTVANAKMAMKQNLVIIPVVNKIDLPSANPELCMQQLEEILAIPKEEVLLASAKEGKGIKEILEAVVMRVPPPHPDDSLKGTNALIFDSTYNAYRGVVNYVKMEKGTLKRGVKIKLLSNNIESEIKEVGYFKLGMVPLEELEEGSVGYVIANIKSPNDTKIGDTITRVDNPSTVPLPGFKEITPMVFSGIYPIDTADYEQLKFSMAKLQLNDSAFVYQPESCVALGFGFRCGFLGLLHMEIIQERLRREYNMDIIATYPSVIYRVHLKKGDVLNIDNPIHMPDPSLIEMIEEPIIKASIMIPNVYIGEVMNLILSKRGECGTTESIDSQHVIIDALLPLHEILIDFHDKLKSSTKGYGSMDYEHHGYKRDDLVKLDILVHGEPVDAFSCIVHRDFAASRGRQIAERLKKVIPSQMFQVPIQAAIGGKVIARETINQLRKNVLAKCYGGDITRKRKLLEKQKEGKKKMKQVGKVSIPQEAFVEILKSE